MKKLLPTLLLTFIIISCDNNKKVDDKFSIIENEKLQSDLRKYSDYTNRHIKAIQQNQRDLERIYSDSSNYYDEILNKNFFKASEKDRVYFNKFTNELKSRKIQAYNNLTNNKQ